MAPFEIIVIICAVLIVLLVGFIAYRVTTIWDANNFIHIEIKKVLNEIHDDVVDDLRDNRLADILKELDKPPFNILMDLPCYHPDGICMNPHMDCINCPRPSTTGGWTTTGDITEENK